MRRKGTPCKYPVRADRITPAYAGKVRKLEYFNVCIGITPAYAGKSLSQVVIPAWD